MRVLPVIDLKSGQVVHAIAGYRDTYRPVESVLCPTAAPADMAAALVEQLDVDTVYVADLDAIAGAEPAWECFGQIAGAGLDLWLDCGLAGVERARRLVDLADAGAPLTGIIAGLESLSGPPQLAELLDCVESRRLVLSLDLKGGQPLVPAGATGWYGLSPQQIVEAAVTLGVMRLIVLDLAQVGMNQGTGTDGLCTWIDAQYPQLELTSGGGVRSLDDLRLLAATGCDCALVASALHDGRLTAADLQTARMW
ncbi:MAG: hypothetical protein K1X74_17745 [Pirellulales bacterium]|nr:hypothetical protein [Pirellulales bacterium]